MKFFIKRLLDIFLSIIGIMIFLPLWIIIIILIKLDSKGPIFYIHPRVGKNNKEFACYKFRSMYTNSDPNTLVSEANDPRVTKTGHYLRISSLDETPQLLNVLLGDMSIVGPRPALPSQVKQFSSQDMDKLLVKPGITGWTQVNGRNANNYEKRMELDCWYAKNWNLLLDLKIILKTPFILFNLESIYDAR